MATLETGRRLADRYVLQERLGDGGHAEVWSALDGHSGRLVALKFLHLHSCSAGEALAVLQHEARMAQRLAHPGVLGVEAPERDGDCVFMPMEYVPGGSAARLRGAHWRQIVPVLLAVARVLQHAHARSVILRDIKPGNVLFDAAGEVRLADFGTSTPSGTRDAPATGSPFSASPQQLRGEPASPADDIYGLGALAYELLTRYPPFYPRFDAEQVQAQDPSRPVSVHPAPAALLDLALSMLAREPAARPPLAAVISALEACLALPADAAEGALVIEAAPAQRPQASARRSGWMRAGWWLGGAAAAGVALILLLPQRAIVAPPAGPVAPAARASVADALILATPQGVDAPAPAADAPAAPEAGEPAAVASLAEELRAGQQALAGLRSAEARAAFRRALVLQPEDPEAQAGLAAAARQEELLAALVDGTRAEAGGDLAGARERYRLLLANEPGFGPARAALARVEQRLADLAFEEHLAAAVEAMRRGRVEEAAAAYARAAAIHPRAARVLDGQERIAEIRRDQQNARDLASGVELEQREQWQAALAHYRQVLERDEGLRFAQDGLARSERRASLDAELADYLARPERLTAPAVRQAALLALARGTASDADSPRLAAQLAQLRGVLERLEVPVRVELTSDNSTQVIVTQLGELGRFQSRALELPPGQYTIIGRRDGFRDVRYELNLAPGQRDTALSVRCTERI